MSTDNLFCTYSHVYITVVLSGSVYMYYFCLLMTQVLTFGSPQTESYMLLPEKMYITVLEKENAMMKIPMIQKVIRKELI